MRAELRRLRNWVLLAFLLIGAIATAGVIEGYDLNGKKKAFDYPLQLAGYDSLDDAVRCKNINSLAELYVPLAIADETDKADGTYYYWVMMNESRELGVGLTISGTITVTVQGTNEADCAPADCAYGELSTPLYGSANWTASAALADTGRIAGQWRIIQFTVTTGGGGTDDYKLEGKRLF